MQCIEDAIIIATNAHRGQIDKGGIAYILHPLRIMLKACGRVDQIVAVMHDVIEDCENWTLQKLEKEGFSDEIITALDALTKRKNELYPDFIYRIAKNPIARRVKLLDLLDNSNLIRIPFYTSEDEERVARYQKAIFYLREYGR